MKTYPEHSQTNKERLVYYFLDLFKKEQLLCRREKVSFKVPQLNNLYESHPKTAYHFKPEVFIQTGGYTEFICPQEQVLLKESEICIMPKGVPHGEIACNSATAFENVVICFYSKTITIHLAKRDENGAPEATEILFFNSDYFDDFLSILNRCSSLYHSNLEMSGKALSALMAGFFALLLNMLEMDIEDPAAESQRIYRCRWLIRNHLRNNNLSVCWLAKALNCSSNYLSKQFRDETGSKITHYILNIRLRNALDLLKTTTLSVKEISTACGFSDPNYFSRIFKKSTGHTPQTYRNNLMKEKAERMPKVVYPDHVEFHYGYDRDHQLIQGE